MPIFEFKRTEVLTASYSVTLDGDQARELEARLAGVDDPEEMNRILEEFDHKGLAHSDGAEVEQLGPVTSYSIDGQLAYDDAGPRADAARLAGEVLEKFGAEGQREAAAGLMPLVSAIIDEARPSVIAEDMAPTLSYLVECYGDKKGVDAIIGMVPSTMPLDLEPPAPGQSVSAWIQNVADQMELAGSSHGDLGANLLQEMLEASANAAVDRASDFEANRINETGLAAQLETLIPKHGRVGIKSALNATLERLRAPEINGPTLTP